MGRKDSGDGKTQGEGTHAKGRTQDPPTRQRRYGEADEVAPKLAESIWRATADEVAPKLAEVGQATADEKGDAQDISTGAAGCVP